METVDLIVVGAGPAGAIAALTAAQLGASVTLIDEHDQPGGSLRWLIHEIPDLPEPYAGQRGFEVASTLAKQLAASNVNVELNAAAWGIFEEHVVGVARGDQAWQVAAPRIILASGSTDIVWPFRGWTLPGVITARAARIFMHQHRVLPGRRWVILGEADDAAQLADAISMAGAEVAGRSANPGEIVAGGDGEVQWVEIAGQHVDADTVVLALGDLPDPELARQALAQISYDERSGCHVPVRSETLETTVPGLYIVGEGAGLCTPAVALAEGELAAHASLASDGLADAQARLNALTSANGTSDAPAAILDPDAIPDEVLIDREENITAAQVRQAISEEAITINDVKRRTRAGMGISQGRDTEYVIARMIHAQAGVPLADLTPMTARPPTRLISLEAMASLATRVD